MSERIALKALLRALARERSEESPDHPELEELARYADGELTEGHSEGIREHLAFCEVCADRALALSEPRFEERSGWWLGDRFGPVLALSGAALLLLVSLGLGLWSLELSQRLERAKEAQSATLSRIVDAVVVEFAPAALHPTRGPGLAEPERVPAGRPLLMILNTTADLSVPSLRIEVVLPGGAGVLESADVAPTEDGTLVRLIPAGLKEPGSYVVRLLAVDGVLEQELERFELEVVDE